MPILLLTPRKTKIRTALIRIFQTHPEPVSLNELYQLIRLTHPKTAYSTVFRQVLKLETEGQVVRIDWRERGSRYEWADRPHHHHIVCQVCGTVRDLDCDLFQFREKEIETSTGFLIERHSIELEGVCPACQTSTL